MKPVLIDMDGVLADFDTPLFEYFAPVLEIGSLEEQTHRFLNDHFDRGISGKYRKVYAAQMRNLIEARGWFRDLEVMPGAQEGVDRLLSLGHDVWICSKPLEASPTCASEKFAWIAEHFPELVGKLVLAPNKGMVSGSVLIDDGIKPEWLSYANWIPVIYDHPWNRQGKYSLPDARLKGRISWASFLETESLGIEAA